MIFRRQEGFRYSFNKPIDCNFKIIKIDDSEIDTEFGFGQIVDISPNGLKMISSLNLSPTFKKIEIQVHFLIDEQAFITPGIIQWQKKEWSLNVYSYGIKLVSSEETAANIVAGLKKHAEKTMNKK
ncbi:MAG TPA: PilZ domain-containing protein [Bacillales bacterium]|nr:PilZ domain-containing protein [Bacillales bacterium]